MKVTSRIKRNRSTLSVRATMTHGGRGAGRSVLCSSFSSLPLFPTPLSCHGHDVAPCCAPPTVGSSLCTAEASSAAAGLQCPRLHDVQTER